MNIGVIILAGGSSTRMTGYKQLLDYKGKSFIKRLCDQLSALSVKNIICVTGHLHEELKSELKETIVHCIHNPDHEKGMVTTLKVGIREVMNISKSSDAVLVCLTDQPLIPLEHYKALIQNANTSDSSIITSGYDDTVGPPVIFKSAHYQSLLDLPKGKSAKSLIKQHLDTAIVLQCAEASKDIDTDQDYKSLIDG